MASAALAVAGALLGGGALLALAVGLAAPALAGTFSTTETGIVVLPGNQLDAAISGRFVVYTDSATGNSDVSTHARESRPRAGSVRGTACLDSNPARDGTEVEEEPHTCRGPDLRSTDARLRLPRERSRAAMIISAEQT
jgi:hypothetical protein